MLTAITHESAEGDFLRIPMDIKKKSIGIHGKEIFISLSAIQSAVHFIFLHNSRSCNSRPFGGEIMKTQEKKCI